METEKIIIEINSIEDLDALKSLKENTDYIININKSLDLKDVEIGLIDASTNNITINGNNKSLYNLNIENNERYTGLFSRVQSLIIENLNVIGASIKGDEIVGTLAGEISDELYIIDSKISSDIEAYAYAGGACGIAGETTIEYSEFDTKCDVIDIAGGVVGMTNNVSEHNCEIFNSIKAKGKAIGLIAGYDVSKESENIDRMLAEALTYLPIECTYEEMKELELILKKK